MVERLPSPSMGRLAEPQARFGFIEPYNVAPHPSRRYAKQGKKSNVGKSPTPCPHTVRSKLKTKGGREIEISSSPRRIPQTIRRRSPEQRAYSVVQTAPEIMGLGLTIPRHLGPEWTQPFCDLTADVQRQGLNITGCIEEGHGDQPACTL